MTAPVVAVSVRLGERTSQVRFIEQGGLLPAGVEEASLTHLLSLGAIAEHTDEAADIDTDEGDLTKLSSKDLDALAAERGINLAGAKTKSEKIATLESASIGDADPSAVE